MHLSPRWLRLLSVLRRFFFFFVFDFLFIVTPIVGVCNCSMFCCLLLYVRSSIAIILMGKRELIALLNLSSWCLVMVERLFLAVPRGCLQFVIVVFPDHTLLLFWIIEITKNPDITLFFTYHLRLKPFLLEQHIHIVKRVTPQSFWFIFECANFLGQTTRN